ncbi:MAG TPA: adenylate/guanylate cyclase domain-containing protein [Leptospiraceae bacterium]|nr:adenylate/guanylate cyclase domain-containing protein [Leptospiraceae bacterium]HMX33282.1 adenylate/guanylate cyclase domain-containing protein [Leptospiraceae bacterium]HMY33159.1 adenylate/guanylate cyclase domain-containing protein [Leptospiraceae bacterium]HMZ67541.1 adenylate/guanylate cyclase domain-containing protein [Leptospiraceae bacterium]HNC00269.1 adenylate/guanylate cyclase domain-containing protein [Leptospiraceae bacterium]
MKEKEVRYQLAKELARYFLYHLKEELKKPEAVTEYITMEGVPFKKIIQDMIQNLVKEFPDLDNKLPTFNLFHHWWKRTIKEIGTDSSKPYEESTFKSQNQMFFFKIIDIKKKESLLRRRYEENMEASIRGLRAKGRNIGFETIFRSEYIMFPLIELIIRRSRLPYRSCLNILLEQNFFIQGIAYRIFDSELKESFKKTDDILDSILPHNIVDELKLKGKVEPKLIPSASILFCDLVGFTNISTNLPPEKLLSELDGCYSHFDKIVKMKGLEKIKTIGDSYMAAGGISSNGRLHAIDAILSALKIQEFLRKYEKSQERKGLPSWKVRIGIHTGQVVCGILGEQRFNFDIWGDTVNTAQRMEAYGEAEKINVSKEVYEDTKEFFNFESRGKIQVKGKGDMEMYFVTGIKENLSISQKGKTPNSRFLQLYLSHLNNDSLMKEFLTTDKHR